MAKLSLGIHAAPGATSLYTDAGILDWIDTYRLDMAADVGKSEADSRHIYPSMFGLWCSLGDVATYAGSPGPAQRVFPTNTLMNGLAARGVTAMFNAAPTGPGTGPNVGHFTLQRILDGEWDAYFDAWTADYLAWAAQVRGYSAQCDGRHPMVLYRWAWEMNTTYSPGPLPWQPGQQVAGDTANTAAIYRKVFQHVHDRIRVHNGATGVKMVWCPWSPGQSAATTQPFYPGDGYVQYAAFDGYSNGGNGRPSGEALYGHGISVVSQITSKPIIIAETGIGHDGFSDTDRAAWLTSAIGYLVTKPSVRGYIYFDYGDPNRFYETGIGYPLMETAWAGRVNAHPARIWE